MGVLQNCVSMEVSHLLREEFAWNASLCIDCKIRKKYYHIMKTLLYKHIENFTPKNENFQIKNSVFHISAQNLDCGYLLEAPQWGSSNEYPQSVFEQK